MLRRWLTPWQACSLELLSARDTQLKLFNSCFISTSHPYPHPNFSLRGASTPEAHDISLQSPVRGTTKAINFPAGSQYSLFICWNIINVSRLQAKLNPGIPRMVIPATDGRVIWNYHRLIWLETHHLRFNTKGSVTPRKIEPSAILGHLLWYRAGIGHSKLHRVVGPAWPGRNRDELAKSDALKHIQGWVIRGERMGNILPRQRTVAVQILAKPELSRNKTMCSCCEAVSFHWDK